MRSVPLLLAVTALLSGATSAEAPPAPTPTGDPRCQVKVGNLTASLGNVPTETLDTVNGDNHHVELYMHLCGDGDFHVQNEGCNASLVFGTCDDAYHLDFEATYSGGALRATYSGGQLQFVNVVLVCDPQASASPSLINTTTQFSGGTAISMELVFSTAASCPGYVPSASPSTRLTAGAIAGIVVGFVALAIVGVALFKYRAGSPEKGEYQRV